MGANEVVEFHREFGAVEIELRAMNGVNFSEYSTTAKAFDDLLGESADDGVRPGRVVDGVPFVDLSGDGHAAEEDVLFNEGDGKSETRGAHRSEDTRARAADYAKIGFMADGDRA
jgi:hypothetical protein